MGNRNKNRGNSKPHFLYVEDDYCSADILKRYTKDICEVESVSSGEEFLKLYKNNNYFGYMIDIKLLGSLNGIRIVESIKKDPENCKKPVIAITACGMSYEREYFLSIGFSHYILKPYLKEDLLDLLNELLTDGRE